MPELRPLSKLRSRLISGREQRRRQERRLCETVLASHLPQLLLLHQNQQQPSRALTTRRQDYRYVCLGFVTDGRSVSVWVVHP